MSKGSAALLQAINSFGDDNTPSISPFGTLPDLHHNTTWRTIEKLAATDSRFTHVVKGMLELRETLDAVVKYLEGEACSQ